MSAIEKINDVFSLKRFVPLNELDHDKLKELMESSSVLQFKKDQPLVSGIEKNHNVYLLSGSVVSSPNSERAHLIKTGDSHARQAIINPNNRTRMVAASSVSVLCVDAELLDFLLNWGADDGFVVDEINTGEANEWVDGLLQNDAILSLSPQSIQILMSVVEPVEVHVNEVVFNQGDKPDYYYIVSRGACAVTRRVEGCEKLIELARLGPGDAFGEEALIANSVRGATVSMSENGLLLRLDQRNFKELLEQSLVNNITDERAGRLKASGALVLDLCPAGAFSAGGSAINVPYTELRSRIDSLDKNKKYIVVSDDNDLSAVGAFLLSKKGFKVYLLKTKGKAKDVATSVQSTARIKKLESKIVKLQRQLRDVDVRLEEEEHMHAASKKRIFSLEVGLKETEDSAKKAIVEASALKNKSESSLRERINLLTTELEKEQRKNRQLDVESENLKSELQSLQNEFDQMHRQAEGSKFAISGAQNREAEIEKKFADLQQDYDSMLSEKIQLSQRVDEIGREFEGQGVELNNAQERFQMVSAMMENLEEDLQVLQLKNVELEECLGKSEEEKQLLIDQLDETNQISEHRVVEINDLRKQLLASDDQKQKVEQQVQSLNEKQQALQGQIVEVNQIADQKSIEMDDVEAQKNELIQKAEKAEKDNVALQAQRSELEAELAQEKEETLVLRKQCDSADQKIEQQTSDLESLQEELYSASTRADHNYNTLQQQLESRQQELTETKERFVQAESGYQQKIDELGAEVRRTATEAKQLAGEVSRQKLRNQVIIEEMSKLQVGKTRSGVMFKFLFFVFSLLAAGGGAAHFMGMDVYAEASVLIETVVSKLGKF